MKVAQLYVVAFFMAVALAACETPNVLKGPSAEPASTAVPQAAPR
jgi:hypothetical protein